LREEELDPAERLREEELDPAERLRAYAFQLQMATELFMMSITCWPLTVMRQLILSCPLP
jgi:hypothetical protein